MRERHCVSVVGVPHYRWVYWQARRYEVRARRDGVRTWRAGPFVGPRRRSERLAWQDARETPFDVLPVKHGQPERLMNPVVWVLLDRMMELAPDVGDLSPTSGPQTIEEDRRGLLRFHLQQNSSWPHLWVAALASLLRDDPHISALVRDLLGCSPTEDYLNRVAEPMWAGGLIEDYDELRARAWPLHQALVGHRSLVDTDNSGPVMPIPSRA